MNLVNHKMFNCVGFQKLLVEYALVELLPFNIYFFRPPGRSLAVPRMLRYPRGLVKSLGHIKAFNSDTIVKLDFYWKLFNELSYAKLVL